MTVALVPSPPSQLIEGWFLSLYRYCDGWITLFSIDKESGARFVDWAKTDRPDEIAAIATERAARCDVWYGVATRKEPLTNGKRGGASDCLHIPAMWADIDILGPNHSAADLPPDLESARQLLAEYPLAPTVTVHSGGGLQPLWMLSEPLDAAHAGEFLERWGYTWTTFAGRHGWHVDNVWDVARIMRVPGTQNRKHEPTEVKIVDVNKGRRYGLDDLDQWMFDPPVREATERVTVPYIGPQRPGDAFNAVYDGAKVLEAAGFTLEHTDSNGDRHYHAPGAMNATGATVYAEDGHTTIWSETAAARWPGLQVRRPYDPFGLYSHLNHGGNWVAASDELARQGYGTKHVGDLPAIVASPTADEATAESSWAPRNLASVIKGIVSGNIQRPTPTIGLRTDGQGLFYPGRVNALWGESGDGKSWAALYACKQEIDQRNHVIYVDYEDDDIGTVSRLLQLGLTADDITTYLHYFWPDSPATLNDIETHLKNVIREYSPTLTVIDSAGESMAIDGVKPNDDDAVARWFRVLPSLFSRSGSAVVVIDHVTKDREQRGLYAIGSQRKRAAVNGAAYMVEAIKPFGQGMAGLSKLVVAKDRNGNYLRGHKVAEFHLDCTADDTRVSLLAPSQDFRPTHLMEKTSQVLEGLDEPVNTGTLRSLVGGKNDPSKTLALDLLVKEGYVRAERIRNGFQYISERPYREDDEIENLVSSAFKSEGHDV